MNWMMKSETNKNYTKGLRKKNKNQNNRSQIGIEGCNWKQIIFFFTK